MILWHVDPLLGNDREISMFPRQQENTAIMEETFSTRSVPICYKQDQLAVAVRELLGFSRCELLLLEAGS
jgi:hypothetical protein